MKKCYFLILVAALLFQSSYSQNDPNAKKVLDGVSSKVKTFKGITASFTIRFITSKGKDNGTKTGSISYKGQKYFIKQGKTEIICDGVKTYNFDGNKTITVSSVEESNQTLNPQNLLSNFYDKDFTYKLASSAGNYHEIEMLPIDKRKNFKQVNVFIDKSKNLITKARILDKSDNTIEFSLSSVNTNASLPDSRFVFDVKKYPGVEVINQ